MSEIKALKELRKLKGEVVDYRWGVDFNRAVDALEAEIAERFMELPVDADGVPICVGEDVVRTNDRLQPEVVRVIGVSGGSVFFKHEGRVKQNVAHNLHHVKPRTLESVLADLANEVWEASCTCQTTWSDSGLDGIEKKYAAEIRELMEAEE